MFSLGFDFANRSSAKITEQNAPVALASTTVNVNYTPLILIIVLVAIIIIWVVVKLLSNKKSQKNSNEEIDNEQQKIKK